MPRKYRGFVGQVPSMNGLGITRLTYEQNGGRHPGGYIQVRREPLVSPAQPPQESPLQPPPVVHVPIKQPPAPSLPPPEPGTGPIDTMQPDTEFTLPELWEGPLSPRFIGTRGSGPSGTPEGVTAQDVTAQAKPDEAVAFPFRTANGEKPVAEKPGAGAGWIIAAIAAALLLGG